MKFLFSITGCAGVVLSGHAEMEEETRRSAVLTLLEGGDFKSVRPAVEEATKTFKDYKKLNLPSEVSFALGSGDVVLDDGAISKARKILNGMMESAQNELDEKTMRCKEFHERNRGQWGQVDTDLKRLSTQISNLEGIKQDSTAEINKSTEFVNTVEEELLKEQITHDDLRRIDEEEMVWRKNDLRVAEFLLKLTKCKGANLLQTFMAPLKVKRCRKGKKHTAFFAKQNVQRYLKSMSHHGQQAIHSALLSATTSLDSNSGEEMLQEEQEDVAAAPAPAPAAAGASTPPPQKPKTAAEGSSKPASKRKQAKKCSLGRPNCGLLHDNMSIMWGGMKDAVDALDTKMRREEKIWNKKLENWNSQISLATGNKETSQGHLSSAMAEQTADLAEQDKKEQEERRLEAEFRKGWAQCKNEMNEILFTKFCGVKAARGQLHKKGAVKPEDIQDCEVSDWIAQACTVPCDDQLVGGMQEMVREIIQQPNEKGVKCPELVLMKKCNEIPCPVDCKMERWSSWSSCTTDCGGGVKSRTRSVDIRPKNGGSFCDVPSEVTACNTGSCDRNCNLSAWKFRPCSVSCGGGYEVKKKHVRRRARGKGKCPRKRNRRRYLKRRCNVHECYGDEECLAKVDIVVAIDGSGSVKKKGFKVLKDFAAEFVKHFRGKTDDQVQNEETGEYEKKEVTAAQIGVIQFGNGVLDENNVVGPAEIIQGLSADTKAVSGKIEGLGWRKGFTNMAQAFTGAESVFLNGGRKHAQSVMVVISDGKPSFNFQTRNVVRKARRKGVKVVMVVVKEFLKTDSIKLMKSWSSVPRSTNFIHIPGLKELKFNMHHWVNKVVIRSCSKTISLRKEAEEQARRDAAEAIESLAKDTGAGAPAPAMFMQRELTVVDRTTS